MTAFQPGERVRSFAMQCDWHIHPGINLIVEGDTDVRYLAKASELYALQCGKHLTGHDLFLVSAGPGKSGGTKAMQEHFQHIAYMAARELGPDQRPVIRLGILVDDDFAGKTLVGRFATIPNVELWHNLFLVKRRLPTDANDAKTHKKRIDVENNSWNQLDCEIEDLVPDIINIICSDHNDWFKQPPQRVGDCWHFEFMPEKKGLLAHEVCELATLKDLQPLVELLIALRHYMRLKPKNGVTI